MPRTIPQRAPKIAGLISALLCGLPLTAHAQLSPEQIQQLPPVAIEQKLPHEHPAAYLLYASRWWGEGKGDAALFWFYVGQLRYRFHLSVNPKQEPGGEFALAGALFATLGEPINLYAGGDIPKWIQQIDRVLAWDAATDNGFTSKTDHAKEWDATRTGLQKLRDKLRDERPQLEAKRREAGIGRVGVFDGVYLEERKPAMPKEWPALKPTTLADLAGDYEATFQNVAAATFFPVPPPRPAPQPREAKVLRLTVASADQLEAVALRDGNELGRRTWTVASADGVVTLRQTSPASGGNETSTTTTVRLSLNVEGELVIERHFVSTGNSGQIPTRRENIFWSKAKPLSPAQDAKR